MPKQRPGAKSVEEAENTGEPSSPRWAEPFVLETQRTRLRPSTANDAARLFPLIHRQAAVTDWICWDGPESHVDLIDRYVSWRLHTPAEPVYVFVVERVRDGAAIGEGTLRFDGHPGTGDLGYWLGEAFHGSGHGRDTVELLVRAGFEYCAARTLTAQVKAGNDRSLHLLDEAGFQREALPIPTDALQAPPSKRPIGWIATLTHREWEQPLRP